ncbi:4Fe-4S binding protein [Gudongella sp. SC589]|uniref:4Fe-4S binding protein n=1 Tax=Gudongella sp. SC589 TaxID=3385990 RepID=UPI00390469B3
MKTRFRKSVQLFFLGIFILLVILNKPQLWMGLLLLGVAASFIFGRLYCGWICSINTVMEAVTAFKRKSGIRDRKIPDVLKRPLVRWGMLLLFFATFILVMRTGKQMPILPVLFLFGIILTFFFHEELWHRFLCPYGSILNRSSRNPKYGMKVDPDLCISCGRCVNACPALAIEKDEVSHFINREDCLVCMKCTEVCTPNAITYE